MGAKITKYKGQIAVRCDNKISRAYTELAGKGKLDAKTGCWMIKFSSRTCYHLVKTLKEAKEIDYCDKTITDAATKYYYALKGREETEARPIEGMRLKPWLHQHQGFEFGKALEGVMLNMDMGCGKTYTTIAITRHTEGARKIITVCPKKVIGVWPKELNKYLVENNFHMVAPDGEKVSVEKRAQLLSDGITFTEARGMNLWFVTNYDSIWREPLCDIVLKEKWDILILDEIHKIKTHDGRASKFCWKVARRTQKRIGLSGTIMPHSPLDVYAQFRALDESVFGTSYTAFKKHYVVYGGFNNKEIQGYINMQEMHDKIDSITYRVGSEVLDLPPITHIDVECDLSESTRKLYTKLEKELYAEVESGEITIANALVKIIRLQQVTGGFLALDDNTMKRVDSSKQELLEEILDDTRQTEPIVVFYRFDPEKHAIEEACKKYGRRMGELSGKRNDLDAWDAGDFDVLAVQIQAGGVGIDLTRACIVIYYSVGYNMGDYLQSLKRAHRPGQTRPTRVFHLIVRKTIDVKVYKALETKEEIVNYVLKEIMNNPLGNKMCNPGGMELKEEVTLW